MFNNKKVESLEQSVATLTEELNSEKEAISNLLECLKKTNECMDKMQSEKDELEKKYNAFKKAFEESYMQSVDRNFLEIKDTFDKNNSIIKETISEIVKAFDELKYDSDKADEKHNAQIEALTKSTEALVKKCEDIQLSNVQIMNQHNDMIKRYEASIKEYAEQAERMRNNVLKKINANNIISVVEE